MGKHQRTTKARGYGSGHTRERKRWMQVIARAGAVRCVCDRPECSRHDGQCPTLIRIGDRWDLGHTADRAGWTGPECPPCNRADGGRHGAKVSNGRRQIVIRSW